MAKILLTLALTFFLSSGFAVHPSSLQEPMIGTAADLSRFHYNRMVLRGEQPVDFTLFLGHHYRAALGTVYQYYLTESPAMAFENLEPDLQNWVNLHVLTSLAEAHLPLEASELAKVRAAQISDRPLRVADAHAVYGRVTDLTNSQSYRAVLSRAHQLAREEQRGFFENAYHRATLVAQRIPESSFMEEFEYERRAVAQLVYRTYLRGVLRPRELVGQQINYLKTPAGGALYHRLLKDLIEDPQRSLGAIYWYYRDVAAASAPLRAFDGLSQAGQDAIVFYIYLKLFGCDGPRSKSDPWLSGRVNPALLKRVQEHSLFLNLRDKKTCRTDELLPKCLTVFGGGAQEDGRSRHPLELLQVR